MRYRNKVIGVLLALCLGIQAHASVVKKQIIKTAAKHKVNSKLCLAIAKVESNFKTPLLRSKNIGIFQIRYKTAKEVGFDGSVSELLNPTVNIEFGIRYIKYCQRRYGTDLAKIICCYNAGWTASNRVCRSKQVRKYSMKVMASMEKV